MTVLAEPLPLPCGAVLPNRLAKAAMSERLGATNGAPGAALPRLYSRWAAGGAGLLITGNVMVDGRHLAEQGNVVVEDDRDLAGLTAWAAAARSGGGHAWLQINHPGRQAPRTIDPAPVAPSAVPLALGPAFATPRALEEAEIEDLIRRFARAAALARKAGFTGVQVHGAHGYLVSQFLSPLANVRTDKWGGTPENRRRFLLEVVAAMRAEVGPAFPIAVKLNSADFQRGGFGEDESLAVVVALEAAGVDLLEVSGGTYERPAMVGVRASTQRREAYFLEFAEKVRSVSRIPLLLTGGFRTRAAMEGAITAGQIDAVGLARPLAYDPDLPGRLLAGAEGAVEARVPRTGMKQVDGFLEMVWYGWQLGAMGAGRDPQPGLTGVRAATSYLGAQVLPAWACGLTA